MVFAVHHPGFEFQAFGLAAFLHRRDVTFRDKLQPHGDHAVVDLTLMLEFFLLEIFLGQRILHLLEPVLVHLGGIDMNADQLGIKGLAQFDGQIDGALGVIRIVDGHANCSVHTRSPDRGRVLGPAPRYGAINCSLASWTSSLLITVKPRCRAYCSMTSLICC